MLWNVPDPALIIFPLNELSGPHRNDTDSLWRRPESVEAGCAACAAGGAGSTLRRAASARIASTRSATLSELTGAVSCTWAEAANDVTSVKAAINPKCRTSGFMYFLLQ